MAAQESVVPAKRKIEDADYELLGRISSLFDDDEFHDFVVISGGRTFKVHKNGVAPASSYFSSAIRSGFKEGITGKIELLDDDPKIVEIMLRFIYEPYYPSAIACMGETHNQMITDINVSTTAEKYLMPRLVEKATESFKRLAESQWYTFEFVQAASELFNYNAEETEHSKYADSPLRQIAVEIIGKYTSHLLRDNKDGTKSEFYNLIGETPMLGVAIAKRIAATPILHVQHKTYICQGTREVPCCRTFTYVVAPGNWNLKCNSCGKISNIHVEGTKP